MTTQYKRKFLVPGDTIKTCWDFRKQCRKQFGSDYGHLNAPCYKQHMSRDESKCPFPINKPTDYIVAETEDGHWQCSCPVWKFRREECHHIRKAKANPEKYEIAVDWTGKSVETIKKVTG